MTTAWWATYSYGWNMQGKYLQLTDIQFNSTVFKIQMHTPINMYLVRFLHQYCLLLRCPEGLWSAPWNICLRLVSETPILLIINTTSYSCVPTKVLSRVFAFTQAATHIHLSCLALASVMAKGDITEDNGWIYRWIDGRMGGGKRKKFPN